MLVSEEKQLESGAQGLCEVTGGATALKTTEDREIPNSKTED